MATTLTSAPSSSVRPRRRHRFARAFVPLGLVAATFGSAARAEADAVTATVKTDVLTVKGTISADTLIVRLRSGDPNTIEVDVGGDGSAEFAFDRNTFSKIVVDGGTGDDMIRVDHSGGVFTDTEQTTLKGGDGVDTILGDVGGETLDGGNGNDFLDGNQGTDVIKGGGGNDTIQWDPGDGSDTVDGGGGADHLAFNGSNIAEQFAFSTDGSGRVRMTRNIAAITMDLDNVEAVDLRTLSGADSVTVDNVTGTDLKTINTDLAPTGGGDDSAVDDVFVPPGTTIGSDGTAGVVSGLGAQVRVLNGSATDRIHVNGTAATDTVTVAGTAGADAVSAIADGTDATLFGATPGVHVRLTAVEQLHVDLGAGNDQFNATGNLAALVAMTIDGGIGNDTILGGNGNDTMHGGSGDDFLDGNQGTDTVTGDTGNDTMQWDPGDSSDTVDGGIGADRLVFNGSNIGEKIALSANGTHAQLTRDVASINMDLTGLETVDVRALGGTDAVTVNDLTGTGVLAVNADLAPFGGGDDAAVDDVIVPTGTTIGTDGTAGVVDGLGAKVRVVNGSATDRIHVFGTAAPDAVTVTGTGGADVVSTVADTTDVAVFGATPGVHVRLTAVEQLRVALGAGDDQFNATGNLAPLVAMTIDGGTGNDTLLGGNGVDTLLGNSGNDFIDGNQGNDLIDAGAGNDTVQWDPGDGSDTVDGGIGTDHMAFNGSNIAERLELTANGTNVRLTRDIAAITMDLANVETVDARTLGGADTFTINDLTGTTMKTVNVDLGSSVGGGDAAADHVVVNGTAGDDLIAVTNDGIGVKVGGLIPAVRITNAEPTLDLLSVNGLNGTDKITTKAGTSDLIQLDLQP